MRRLVCLLAALAVVSSARVRAEESTVVSEQTTKLVALENAWNQAQIHHDSKSLGRLVSEGFIYTDTDGSVMNKAKFLADNDDPDYRAMVMANDDIQVFSYPNTAVVAGRYHAKGTYKGKPFDHFGRFTDTWIYLDGMWQCVASHTTLLGK